MRKRVNITVGGIEFQHSLDKLPAENLSTNHMHDSYEILYVAQGRGKYLIEGAEFELKPRTILLIKPLKYHCVDVEGEATYERYVINFNSSSLVREAIPAFERLVDKSELESGRFFSPDTISQSVVSVFDKFECVAGVPERDRGAYARLILSELLLLLSAETGSKILQNKDELGAKVIRYINECLDKDVSLDTIAKKFFVSKYYLCRSFKRYSGVSVHSYINHKRIMYAKQLIEAGETAATAAYKVGFGDYSAFYRTHLRILGVPPSLQSKKRSSD